MLIVALVLAVIGLASLVTAVVTGNELIAWVCIGASVLGVILLIVDAIRERQTRSVVADQDLATADDAVAAAPATVDNTYENFDAEYPDEQRRRPPRLPTRWSTRPSNHQLRRSTSSSRAMGTPIRRRRSSTWVRTSPTRPSNASPRLIRPRSSRTSSVRAPQYRQQLVVVDLGEPAVEHPDGTEWFRCVRAHEII